MRVNVALFATPGGAGGFWDRTRSTVVADYEVVDIKALHASSDAGDWFKSLGISDMVTGVVQGSDAFHVM